jgi:hypothetical protein
MSGPQIVFDRFRWSMRCRKARSYKKLTWLAYDVLRLYVVRTRTVVDV